MIRVIGIGSPFGDDAAGWRVIEHLRGRVPEGVELLALDRPGAALLRWFEGMDGVVLIDAIRSGGRPGAVRSLSLDALDGLPESPSTHGFGLAHALRLAGAMGVLPPRVAIHAIELGGLERDGLTPEVEAAARALAESLARDLGGDGIEFENLQP